MKTQDQKKNVKVSWGGKDAPVRNNAKEAILLLLYVVGQFDESSSTFNYLNDNSKLTLLRSYTGVTQPTVSMALGKLRNATASFDKLIDYIVQYMLQDPSQQETVRNALTNLCNSEVIKKSDVYGGYRLGFTSELQLSHTPLLILNDNDSVKMVIDRKSVEYLADQVKKNGICVLTIPTD